MPNKKPNHLASLLDRQAAAKHILPQSINREISRLFALTNVLRELLVNSLPTEIVNNMLVVSYENQQLILSVTSQTAANHLNYSKQPLQQRIACHLITFEQLKNIKVIITYNQGQINTYNSMSTKKGINQSELSDCNRPYKHPEDLIDSDLSIETKQTIAYMADHVIQDPNLQKALKKLIL